MKSCGAETAPVLRSMVAGYFLNTARRQPDGSFKSVSTGQRLVIHPSSVLFQAGGLLRSSTRPSLSLLLLLLLRRLRANLLLILRMLCASV